jgi:clusterin-associated protein 1
MRCLGYPRVVSMENFRVPNFELVADCLEFLVTRYDETASVDGDISTEKDRVHFLENINKVFAQKARVKLNLKRLYSADGVAVKELLKIAEVLRRAMEAAGEGEEGDLKEDMTNLNEDVTGGDGNKSNDALNFDSKQTRQLAGDIVHAGAATHDCLRVESDELRVARHRAMNGTTQIAEIEKLIEDQIGSVKENVVQLERGLIDLAKDEKTLRVVLEKRKTELERGEKRLGSLQNARPAFMDEFETLKQITLPVLYQEYLERHRNLTYLESALDERRKMEEAAANARETELKKMRGRLREEEMRVLRGEDATGDDEFGYSDEEKYGDIDSKLNQKHGGGKQNASQSKSFKQLSSRTTPSSGSVGGARAPQRFGIGGGVVGGVTSPASTKKTVTGSMMGGDLSDSDDGIRDDGDSGSSSDENDF